MKTKHHIGWFVTFNDKPPPPTLIVVFCRLPIHGMPDGGTRDTSRLSEAKMNAGLKKWELSLVIQKLNLINTINLLKIYFKLNINYCFLLFDEDFMQNSNMQFMFYILIFSH
jgi:hypothetical protein